MLRFFSAAPLACLLATASACGSPARSPGTDADAGAGGDAALPAAPVLASLVPCPDGWREIPAAATDSPSVCDPWPDTGEALGCGAGEAHFPGEPGCAPAGAPCPTGDFADTLPATGVVYVSATAPAGGDGTRARPFARIADAMLAAAPGATIAVAKGVYDEAVALDRAVTLQGACAAETILAPSSPSDSTGAITVSTRGVVVRDVAVAGERVGIWAGAGAGIDLAGVSIDGVRLIGMYVADGATVSGTGVIVRNVRTSATGRFGRGINVELASLSLDRVAVEQARGDVAVFAGLEGTSLALDRAVIRDSDARAVEIRSAASATIARTAIERSREVAVYEWEPGTSLALTDSVVRGTRSASDATAGRAVDVLGGASATLSRVAVLENREAGLRASDAATTMTLEDVVVRDTASRETDLSGGHALVVYTGATVGGARVYFERSRDIGVMAQGEGASIALEDVVVRDTLEREAGSDFGFGIHVLGATVTLERALIADNRGIGVLAGAPGTRVTLTDAVIRGTRERACVVSECAGAGAGIGLGSYAEAAIEARSFVVRDNALAGVQLASGILMGEVWPVGGVIDLHDGLIANNPIGANVQTEGFDYARLTDRVAFEGNERVIVTDLLPVPPTGIP